MERDLFCGVSLTERDLFNGERLDLWGWFMGRDLICLFWTRHRANCSLLMQGICLVETD